MANIWFRYHGGGTAVLVRTPGNGVLERIDNPHDLWRAVWAAQMATERAGGEWSELERLFRFYYDGADGCEGMVLVAKS